MNKRKDHRGRLLHTGEVQLPDKRYRYKYVDSFGKEHAIYSWRLDHNDKTPAGKKHTLSLREMEKKIEADLFDHIIPNGGNLTVLELVEKYTETKISVRPTTKAGYKTVIRLLQKDPFGQQRIDSVRLSDAKLWLIKLQKIDKRSYSSVQSIRGVLRPAFQLATDDDLIRKNPFAFELVDVIINDSITRDALSREQERNFLDFIKKDKHYRKYYEAIYILFNTGLRISEFCGLTLSDIDIKNHKLNIDHQLLYIAKIGRYIQQPKTKNGIRTIPLTPDVEKCFKTIIKKRNAPKIEPIIDGYTGFLFFNKLGEVCCEHNWAKYFERIVRKYNNIYKKELPKITPHVCRHTYCTKMAKSGMNPKTLEYLMGHSDISTTLNIYTHEDFTGAEEELKRLRII